MHTMGLVKNKYKVLHLLLCYFNLYSNTWYILFYKFWQWSMFENMTGKGEITHRKQFSHSLSVLDTIFEFLFQLSSFMFFL